MKLPRTPIMSRLDVFKEHIIGNTTLHIGCSDWPDTREKVHKGSLLHQWLQANGSDVYGTDISSEGIQDMIKAGIHKIRVGSVYDIDSKNEGEVFDTIIVSEVMEHLDNPGKALEALNHYIRNVNPDCKVIFTVPNINNFHRTLISTLKCEENVHDDHNFYFSYRTFKTLMDKHGFETKEFHWVIYERYPPTIKGKIGLWLLSRTIPNIAPYLCFVCKYKVK